ncbi:MAG TPA: serine protease [Caulobacteraceae bacterium]|nr:serine protease [Caulobacteraceae bacterium]
MALDMSVDLIGATVQLEQPLADGTRTVGTGFLISDPTDDGKPRVVLVTANHVFKRMPGDKATIGYRIQQPDGSWKYAPQQIAIRRGGKELWTHHGSRDVAAITITAPEAFAKAAIPLGWLASDDTFNRYQLGPGDEMMALGFPQGLAANPAGFPILRSGRVASYPLGPSSEFPTFLLDFRVFPGNSGGPVYLDDGLQRREGAADTPEAHFIAGMLTQQVELGGESLEIGIVTEARFIRETVAELDGHVVPSEPAAQPASVAGVFAADSAATSP